MKDGGILRPSIGNLRLNPLRSLKTLGQHRLRVQVHVRPKGMIWLLANQQDFRRFAIISEPLTSDDSRMKEIKA